MSDFQRALAFVLEREGGFVDHPADPGGATNQGVSLRAVEVLRDPASGRLLFDFDGDGDVDELDIRQVPDHPEARDAFYRDRYWLAARCDRLWWPLSLLVFDVAVNSGLDAASRNLQRALLAAGHDQPITGTTGPVTLRRVGQVTDRAALVELFLHVRERFYRALVVRRPAQRVFLAGWLRRVAELRAAAKGA